MPVIKRYANRKLYDTDAKRYVTLDDLAAFIRAGDDVRVVDHVTGEDLTSVTLMQVIFEEEKKIGGLLPQVMLTRLIRAGGSTVNTLRNRLSFLDPFQMVDEEIRKRVQALVEKGTLDEAEGQRMIDLLVRKPAQNEAARSQGEAARSQGEAARSQGEAVNIPHVVPLPQEQSTLLELALSLPDGCSKCSSQRGRVLSRTLFSVAGAL